MRLAVLHMQHCLALRERLNGMGRPLRKSTLPLSEWTVK